MGYEGEPGERGECRERKGNEGINVLKDIDDSQDAAIQCRMVVPLTRYLCQKDNKAGLGPEVMKPTQVDCDVLRVLLRIRKSNRRTLSL